MTGSNESGTRSSIRAHLLAIAAATVVLVGGIGVMGASTELAGAIIASGTLVVESNVKKVQHPTGGIVGELLVRDGARVKAGDLLVRLDETAAQANVAMVSKSLAELWARRARLEAERDGIDEVEFPADLHGGRAGPRDRAASSPASAGCSSCAAKRSKGRRRSCANASPSTRRRSAASPTRPPPRGRRSNSSRRSSKACATSGKRT